MLNSQALYRSMSANLSHNIILIRLVVWKLLNISFRSYTCYQTQEKESLEQSQASQLSNCRQVVNLKQVMFPYNMVVLKVALNSDL